MPTPLPLLQNGLRVDVGAQTDLLHSVALGREFCFGKDESSLPIFALEMEPWEGVTRPPLSAGPGPKASQVRCMKQRTEH